MRAGVWDLAAIGESAERLPVLAEALTAGDVERQRMLRMSRDVRRLWSAPATTPRNRKRLLRSVLERIVLTAQDHSVKVAVEWKGGQVSELVVKRIRRGEPTLVTDKEVVDIVRRLALEGALDDTQIARVLTQRNMRTAAGLTFTNLRVKSARHQCQIPRGTSRPAGEPCFTAEAAAEKLGVSPRTIHAWLREGLLRGEQLMPGARWRIVLDEDTQRRLTGDDAPAGWVGLQRAARTLGVSNQTVSSWFKSGKLQAVRVARGRRQGWRICVDSTDLEKQLSLGLTKLSTQ